jgi:DNA-binding CsgD family transcriptional regulator
MIPNPYAPIDPDIFYPGIEHGLITRTVALRKLAGYLLNSQEPACVSIVAERGMGGDSMVKRFVRTDEPSRKFRIVECDSKGDLGQGGSVIDFYKALVNHVSKQVASLPNAAAEAAARIRNAQPARLSEIETDYWEFFRTLRESGPPLLLVFYAFDAIPSYFNLEGVNWTLLRELNNRPELRCYLLVVSRRPIPYVEMLHHLQDSLFSTLFSATTIRVGLLSPEETKNIVHGIGKTALGRDPWPDWLEPLILQWSGRNPSCAFYICHELFEQIWIEKIPLRSAQKQKIFQQLYEGLSVYFERLYDNLQSDQLIETLLSVMRLGYSTAQYEKIMRLVELGYFLPEEARDKKYILFSPLFDRYIHERCLGENTRVVDLTVQFSGAETRVLEELARGISEKRKIAEKLGLSLNTVSTHFNSIYKKLDVHKAADAIEQARRIVKSRE